MKCKATLKFTPEAAELAIKTIMKDYPGFGLIPSDTITKVTFVVADRYEGHGMEEHLVARFDGVEIEVERETDL